MSGNIAGPKFFLFFLSIIIIHPCIDHKNFATPQFWHQHFMGDNIFLDPNNILTQRIIKLNKKLLICYLKTIHLVVPKILVEKNWSKPTIFFSSKYSADSNTFYTLMTQKLFGYCWKSKCGLHSQDWLVCTNTPI